MKKSTHLHLIEAGVQRPLYQVETKTCIVKGLSLKEILCMQNKCGVKITLQETRGGNT